VEVSAEDLEDGAVEETVVAEAETVDVVGVAAAVAVEGVEERRRRNGSPSPS